MNLCLSGQRGKFTFIKILGTINSDSKLKIDFSYDVVIVIGSLHNRLYWLSFLFTQYVSHSTSFNIVFLSYLLVPFQARRIILKEGHLWIFVILSEVGYLSCTPKNFLLKNVSFSSIVPSFRLNVSLCHATSNCVILTQNVSIWQSCLRTL